MDDAKEQQSLPNKSIYLSLFYFLFFSAALMQLHLSELNPQRIGKPATTSEIRPSTAKRSLLGLLVVMFSLTPAY